MGVSIEDYRAAIGLFHCTCSKRKSSTYINYNYYTYLEILKINLHCSFYVFSLACLQSINPKIDIIFLLFVLHFILIVGNIEPNPGPDENNISSTPSSVRFSEIDKSISICNLNIRSIRNKLEFLNNFTDEFDVLAVTETHLDPSVSEDQLKLDSFNNIIRKDRNNFGGGLMIYVKDDIGISSEKAN
ncbi:Hypothetical predicted protein [Mytilus galloprovincialis]|uniref:Endonuclease/exonuclease/phosphatase domain-containing protein n=1 Tax=Mytilus galloprovincialis TaxID=29158 RepID=A0A8B6DUQ8_MYTGA|nr:Hypothetical predicted protein [Mytilus galloprovincialis]